MSKVLIVEDDKDIALALAVRMKAKGVEATVTHDAMMGVTMAVRDQPDLILLDISMPAGGGFSVAERLRNLPNLEGTPIIFITASKDPDIKTQAMNYRPVGYFEKPFDSEELQRKIMETLGEAVAER
ncbi:MAG: PleD family two-component system response regulator [Leptospirillia bacterium]